MKTRVRGNKKNGRRARDATLIKTIAT